MAAGVSGELSGGGRSWSTIATMKMVSSAATDDKTGEVNEISTRKDPENAVQFVSFHSIKTSWGYILAFASTEIAIILACSPLGSSNSSHPI
jgi:hypothetical protein